MEEVRGISTTNGDRALFPVQ